MLSQSDMTNLHGIVSLGKHALSPEEGPTTNVERRAMPGLPKPAKRVKASGGFAFISSGITYIQQSKS